MHKLFDHKAFVANEMENEKQFIERTSRSKNNSPTPEAQSSIKYWREQNNSSPCLEPRMELQQKILAKFDELLKEESKKMTSSTICNSI